MGRPFKWVLVTLIIVSTLLPLIWMGSIGLKTRVDALAVPPKVFFVPTLQNVRDLFENRGAFDAIVNSVLIAFGSMTLGIILGVPGGYWMSRAQGRLKENLVTSVLAARMVPQAGIMLSMFLWLRAMGLIDTKVGLIMVHGCFNIVFVCWMIKGFVDQIPVRFEEAAHVDGATEFAAMRSVVLPLMVPGLVLTAFFSFMASWNEFAYALVLTSYEARPITVLVPGLITPQGTYWGQVAVLGVLAALPVLFAAAIARRRLVQGMLYGSFRGV